MQPFLQRFHVLSYVRHLRIDLIRDPACKRQAGCCDGAGGEQGVIDAAEPHPDDQHDRQRETRGKIGGVQPRSQRHAKSARPFDDDAIGNVGKLGVSRAQRSTSITTPRSAAARCGAIGGSKQ